MRLPHRRLLLRSASAASAFFALLGVSGAQQHSLHHPSQAVFALSCPDAVAVQVAAESTSLASFVRDAELLGAVAAIPGMSGDKIDAMVERLSSGFLSQGIRAFSLSVTPTGAGGQDGSMLGLFSAVEEGSDPSKPLSGAAAFAQARLVVDFVDDGTTAQGAERMHGLMGALGLEAMPQPQTPTRDELAGFTEEPSMFVRYREAGAVDTVGMASCLVVGQRVVVRVGAELVPGPSEGSGAPSVDAFAPWVDVVAAGEDQQRGPVLFDLYLAEGVLDLISAQEEGAEIGAPFFGLAAGLMDPVISILFHGGRWRGRIEQGDFTFEGRTPKAQRSHAGVLGGAPLQEGASRLVHPDAQVAHVTSLDATALGQWMQHAAEAADAVEFLDEYGIDPMRQLPAIFGGTLALELRPLRGLATAPDLYLTATVKDPSGLHRLVQSGQQILADFGPRGTAIIKSSYRSATLYTLRLQPEVGVVVSVLGLQPTVVVLGDVAVLTPSLPAAKRWIREQGKERAVHAGLLASGAPQGASSVSYGDWSRVFDTAYGYAIEFAPLLEMMKGRNPRLDVEALVAALPKPGFLSRHFRPGGAWTQPLTNGGTYRSAHSSVGPFGLTLGVGLGSTIFAPLVFQKAVVAKDVVTRQRALKIHNGILMYMLEKGEMLESLEALRAFDPGSFPEGSDDLEDAWGRRFFYQPKEDFEFDLWSLGPNGIDDGGEGDDVRAL